MHVMEMKLVNLTAWLGSKLDKWTVLVKLVSFSNKKCAVKEKHTFYTKTEIDELGPNIPTLTATPALAKLCWWLSL